MTTNPQPYDSLMLAFVIFYPALLLCICWVFWVLDSEREFVRLQIEQLDWEYTVDLWAEKSLQLHYGVFLMYNPEIVNQIEWIRQRAKENRFSNTIRIIIEGA